MRLAAKMEAPKLRLEELQPGGVQSCWLAPYLLSLQAAKEPHGVNKLIRNRWQPDARRAGEATPLMGQTPEGGSQSPRAFPCGTEGISNRECGGGERIHGRADLFRETAGSP